MPKIALVQTINPLGDYDNSFVFGIPEWTEVSQEELDLILRHIWRIDSLSTNKELHQKLIIFPDNQKEAAQITIQKLRRLVEDEEKKRLEREEKKRKAAALFESRKREEEEKMYLKLKEKYGTK